MRKRLSLFVLALLGTGILAQGIAPAEGAPADRPAADRPAADRPAADRPAADRPGADRPAAAPAAAPAPRPEAPPQAPAAGPPLRPEQQSYSIRLRQLAERVSSLKEMVSQTKIRLNLLKESVLEQTTAGAELSIVQDNRVGSTYRLLSYRYLLDNKQLDSKTDLDGKASEKGVTPIYTGPALDGVHILTVEYLYRGHGFHVFSYMKGYRFRIQTSHRFKIIPGTHTTILVIPFDKGSGLTSLKDRLAVRYETHVSTLGFKRDAKGRGATPAPSKTNP